MDQRQYSRRAALRGGAGTAAAVGLTGCLERLPFMGGESEPPSLGPVPTDATVVATVDVAALLDDETARQLADAAIPVTDVAGLRDLLVERTGLDVNGLESLTGFHTVGSTSAPPAGAALFSADWTRTELETAVESSAYETTTRQVEGVTVTDIGTLDLSFALLESDQFVAGLSTSVEDVIDVEAGRQPEVGGRLVRAHDQARSGPIQFGIDLGSMTELLGDAIGARTPLSKDILSKLRSASGAVYTTAERAGIEMEITAADRSTGSQVQQFAEAAPTLMTGDSAPRALRDVLDDLEVSRDGNRVTITLEGTVSALTPLVQSIGVQLTTTVLDGSLDLTQR